jgi:hypothetical protein
MSTSINTFNTFIQELSDSEFCISKYESEFDELISEIFSYFEETEKIPDLIYDLHNSCETNKDSLSLEKFYIKMIHHIVENYEDFNTPITSEFYEHTSYLRVSIPEYIEIFFTLNEVNPKLLKEIVSRCVETKNYQLITNLFQCNQNFIMKEMFIIFKENPEYISLFQQLPLTTDFLK